jgi:hypothetical protein
VSRFTSIRPLATRAVVGAVITGAVGIAYANRERVSR